jgi:hypothetical protein
VVNSHDAQRVIVSENMENQRRFLRGRRPVWLPEFPHIRPEGQDNRRGISGALLITIETLVGLAISGVIIVAPVLAVAAFALADSTTRLVWLGTGTGVLIAMAIAPFAFGAVSLATGHPHRNIGLMVITGVAAIGCVMYLWSLSTSF